MADRTSVSRRPTGAHVPAGTLAVVRSPLALRCSTEQNALHTLIHQRHLTPSCGGRREPWTRQGRSDESLTQDPELENSQGSNPALVPLSRHVRLAAVSSPQLG